MISTAIYTYIIINAGLLSNTGPSNQPGGLSKSLNHHQIPKVAEIKNGKEK